MTFRAPARPPKKGALIASYGLPVKLARQHWGGSTDSMLSELYAHEAHGRIVEQSYDYERDLYVYRVYEPAKEDGA